jgi:hypothetical protein
MAWFLSLSADQDQLKNFHFKGAVVVQMALKIVLQEVRDILNSCSNGGTIVAAEGLF